jgi:hypothetical protein
MDFVMPAQILGQRTLTEVEDLEQLTSVYLLDPFVSSKENEVL